MSGMEPMLLGAMLGGGVSAARGGNPITGALLGGIGGGVFGAASGAAGASLAPAATGLKLGATTGLNLGATTGMGSLAPSMGATGLQYGATTAGAASLAPPVFTSGFGLTPAATSLTAMETLKNVPSALKTFAQENPFTTNLASNMVQQEFNQQPIQAMGLMRGTQIPTDQRQRPSFATPPISLI